LIRQAKKERLIEVGRDIADVIRKSAFQEMKEAVAFLRKDPRISSCFGVLFLLWAALGAVYVVSIVFVQEVFASVTKDLGLLVVALGLGLFVGSLGYGRLGRKDHGLGTIFACILGAGVVLSGFVLAVIHLSSLLLAMGLVFVLGLVVSPVMVISNTMVHQLTDNSMRGKVFSSLEVVVHLAFLVSMMVTAPLADRLGSVNILLGVSFFLVLIGIGGLVKVYGQDRRA
jgi:MFS family permease